MVLEVECLASSSHVGTNDIEGEFESKSLHTHSTHTERHVLKITTLYVLEELSIVLSFFQWDG